jgi:hypothetical protein
MAEPGLFIRWLVTMVYAGGPTPACLATATPKLN